MKQLFNFLLCTVLVSFTVFCISVLNSSSQPQIRRYEAASAHRAAVPASRQPKRSNSDHDKWIVITSIANAPTDALIQLSKERKWRIVVVGDTKGPHRPLAAEWNDLLANGAVVLTLEEQKKLNFAVIKLIPTRSYTRKMIGYLYAIQHGAQWIYDTDDDNKPIDKGLDLFDYGEIFTGMLYSAVANDSSVFNPYAFFGRPDMWPRGYPLSKLQIPNLRKAQKLCSNLKTPLVQQGLVAKDPDVDAIFRLLKAHPRDGLNEAFNPHAPPIAVDRGVFTPFNSQNTLFHYDAFFTLALPIGVAFRVTDIWRGYFSQRLLHLVDGRLAFYPVNAIQNRNPHSYLADFKDETALYHDADRMVEVLSEWRCLGSTIEECTVELSQIFVKNAFWTEKDHNLIKAWLADLATIGYFFPQLSEGNVPDCRSAPQHFHIHSNSQKNELMRTNMEELLQWCEFNSTALRSQPQIDLKFQKILSETVLIVTFNFQISETISLIQRLYSGIFAHIIMCGTFDDAALHKQTSSFLEIQDQSFIYLSKEEVHEGYYVYACTAKAIELRLQNVSGYLTIADDTIYNPWVVMDYSRFRIGDCAPDSENRQNTNPNPWWTRPCGKDALDAAMDELVNTPLESSVGRAWDLYDELTGFYGLRTMKQEVTWAVSDYYYLPQRNDWVFAELANVMARNQVFHELAVPRLGAAFGLYEYFVKELRDVEKHEFVWRENRTHYFDFYNADLTFLHPVKLSTLKERAKREEYCNSIVETFRQQMWV